MKKHISFYVLAFGIIMFIIGKICKENIIVVLFGMMPIIISIMLFLIEQNKNDVKKASKSTSFEKSEKNYIDLRDSQDIATDLSKNENDIKFPESNNAYPKQKNEANYCTRCGTELSNGKISICDECLNVIQVVQPQIDEIDTIIANMITPDTFHSFSKAIEEKAKGFLESYLRKDRPIFDFYYSEYPMGAVHSRSFMKSDGIWCVIQDDYDKTPPHQEEKHPEISDDNLAESFIRILIEENERQN